MNKEKIARLTLNDLSRLVESTAKRVMKESIDQSREIQLAYKEIQQDDMITLNNALIKDIKGQRKP